MSNETKALVQQKFGEHAAAFVTSKGHAQGKSLERMVELADPQPSWRVLDIATGGGHAALAFAGRVREVIATDLTGPMLVAARDFMREKAVENASFVRSDSERLAFGDGAFDCVTCRIAAHHFPSIDAFVSECRRVLRPGGIVALADNVVSGEVKVTKYVNGFEKLRDPSHHWAYSVDDWQAAFAAAGLATRHSETFEKDMDFLDWATRMGVAGNDLIRLQAMLVRAPTYAAEWLRPREVSGRLTFTLTEMVLIGQRE